MKDEKFEELRKAYEKKIQEYEKKIIDQSKLTLEYSRILMNKDLYIKDLLEEIKKLEKDLESKKNLPLSKDGDSKIKASEKQIEKNKSLPLLEDVIGILEDLEGQLDPTYHTLKDDPLFREFHSEKLEKLNIALDTIIKIKKDLEEVISSLKN